jgi:SSS family solute:Na+ symporter
MALRGGQAIVALLLMGYNFVTQLFPALVLCLGPRPKVSAAAAFSGILAGALTVAWVTIAGSSIATLFPAAPQFLKDVNAGIIALAVNVIVLSAVSLAVRPPVPTQLAAATD